MVQGSSKRLGELLCEKSYLDEQQLEVALSRQEQQGWPLGQILVELGHITVVQLNEALALQAGIERVDLSAVRVEADAISLVPAELVTRHSVLPLRQTDGRLDVGMVDPFKSSALEDLRLVTGLRIRRYFMHGTDIERGITAHYGSNVARMLEDLAPGERASGNGEEGNGEYSAAKLHEMAREPSLINLVNLVLLEAIEARASDVHIEPFEHQVKIKYRVDGVLVEKSTSPKRLQAAVVSRIKIMAGMNIAERFVPQDGHIEFAGPKGRVDIRVSTVPTVFGESITLRILDRSAALFSMEELGMNPQTLGGFEQCLGKSHGLILVTGPTGSGKTTTLYAALNKIYSPSLKIITIEDPVEYQLEGIIQMPVNPKRGLTFANGLRHILRQDPDIIMVGEIRDRETADIAIRAALTGHLVFSTLHTNDAPGAITRLIDMGVEPFLLASSLEAVLAQRLVRQVCKACRQSYRPEYTLLKALNGAVQVTDDMVFYRGEGCHECMNSGMRGRTGIYEFLRITDALQELITTRPTTEQILKAAPSDHVSMRQDGVAKLLAGVTTAEEVVRATQGTDEV